MDTQKTNAHLANTDIELPSNAKLIQSTIIAFITAVVLLVTVVMPAEYGIDPTGMGKVLGLKKMGEIKASLAQESHSEKNNAGAVVGTKTTIGIATEKIIQSQSKTITLNKDQSAELKLTMDKGDSVKFTWSSDGGKANYDTHGDSKETNYHSYEKGSQVSQEGVLTAEFDGNHGWYWRNRTDKAIKVALHVEGKFGEIKRY